MINVVFIKNNNESLCAYAVKRINWEHGDKQFSHFKCVHWNVGEKIKVKRRWDYRLTGTSHWTNQRDHHWYAFDAQKEQQHKQIQRVSFPTFVFIYFMCEDFFVVIIGLVCYLIQTNKQLFTVDTVDTYYTCIQLINVATRLWWSNDRNLLKNVEAFSYYSMIVLRTLLCLAVFLLFCFSRRLLLLPLRAVWVRARMICFEKYYIVAPLRSVLRLFAFKTCLNGAMSPNAHTVW